MIREENINCTIEALVLASPEPVPVKKLSEAVDNISPARIRQAVDDLNNIYLGCGNSFRIREVAGGYQVHILPDFEQPIKKLLVKQRTVRLSRAALETLAIIAYKQPVTKTEIEHIRGVATDGVIHNLLQRQLIVISGRAETPGRPLLYKTSNEFLKFFGLNRLSDLPRMDEIEEMIRQAETPREQTVLPLNGREGESAVIELSEETEDPGNGDLAIKELVATADVSDLITGFEAFEDGEVQEPQDSGYNGSGTDEDATIFVESDKQDAGDLAEPVGKTEQTASVVAYYEPIPDNPPAIIKSNDTPKAAVILAVSDEAPTNPAESDDNGDQPPDD